MMHPSRRPESPNPIPSHLRGRNAVFPSTLLRESTCASDGSPWQQLVARAARSSAPAEQFVDMGLALLAQESLQQRRPRGVLQPQLVGWNTGGPRR